MSFHSIYQSISLTGNAENSIAQKSAKPTWNIPFSGGSWPDFSAESANPRGKIFCVSSELAKTSPSPIFNTDCLRIDTALQTSFAVPGTSPSLNPSPSDSSAGNRTQAARMAHDYSINGATAHFNAEAYNSLTHPLPQTQGAYVLARSQK